MIGPQKPRGRLPTTRSNNSLNTADLHPGLQLAQPKEDAEPLQFYWPKGSVSNRMCAGVHHNDYILQVVRQPLPQQGSH
eukprot:5491735-Amphidinium_carterae.2